MYENETTVEFNGPKGWEVAMVVEQGLLDAASVLDLFDRIRKETPKYGWRLTVPANFRFNGDPER